MSKKLYIGNLPKEAKKEEIEALFEGIATVTSLSMIMDKTSGEFKGFAFAEIESDDEAAKAISQLNDTAELGGQKVKVNEAKPSPVAA